MKDILSSTTDTLLEKPVVLEIDRLTLTWWERIAIRFRLIKAKRIFVLKPATLGTMIRISKLVLKIDGNTYRDKTLLEGSYSAFEQHGHDLAQIVALALNNRKEEPSNKLIDFILNNLTGKELLSVCKLVLQQLDVASFMSTIISVRGMSLLNTEEIIASGEQSED